MHNFFSIPSGVTPTFTVPAINFKSLHYPSKGITDTLGCSIDEGLNNNVEVGFLFQDLKLCEDVLEVWGY